MKAGEHRSPVLAGGEEDGAAGEDAGVPGVAVEARLPALSNMGNPHPNMDDPHQSMLFPFEHIAFHLRGLGLKKLESAEEGSRMYLIWQ